MKKVEDFTKLDIFCSSSHRQIVDLADFIPFFGVSYRPETLELCIM